MKFNTFQIQNLNNHPQKKYFMSYDIRNPDSFVRDYYDPRQELPWEEWQRAHRVDLSEEFQDPQIWVRSKKDWRVAKVNPRYINPRVSWDHSKYKYIGDLFNKFFYRELPIKPYFYPDYAKRVIKINRRRAQIRRNHINALKRYCTRRFGWSPNSPRTINYVRQHMPKVKR